MKLSEVAYCRSAVRFDLFVMGPMAEWLRFFTAKSRQSGSATAARPFPDGRNQIKHQDLPLGGTSGDCGPVLRCYPRDPVHGMLDLPPGDFFVTASSVTVGEGVISACRSLGREVFFSDSADCASDLISSKATRFLAIVDAVDERVSEESIWDHFSECLPSVPFIQVEVFSRAVETEVGKNALRARVLERLQDFYSYNLMYKK